MCSRETAASYRVESLRLVLARKMVATRFRWLEVAVGSALNIAVETPIVWVSLVISPQDS